MDWINIDIPFELINNNYDNYRAYIFDMPKGSKYEGYTFAHPRKLSRRTLGYYELCLNEKWTFHLYKEKELGELDKESPVVDLSFAEWVAEMGKTYHER